MSWIKYFYITVIVFAVIIFISLLSLKHQANISATKNVNFGSSVINVGEARELLTGNMDREVIEANLLLKIAESQKNHDYETIVNYVFLDENEIVTTSDKDIRSIQFKVELLNKKGKVQSVSTERIEIHSLLGGDG